MAGSNARAVVRAADGLHEVLDRWCRCLAELTGAGGVGVLRRGRLKSARLPDRESSVGSVGWFLLALVISPLLFYFAVLLIVALMSQPFG